MRIFLALAMVMALLLPSAAQEDDAPWQASITAQIQAFRAHDGAAALAMAGEGFRAQFDGQGEAFYMAILATGYQPVVQSRSHSFGEFNLVSKTQAVQIVHLVGPKQGLYDAFYQMVDEPDVGWRVLGVVLRKQAGIGI